MAASSPASELFSSPCSSASAFARSRALIASVLVFAFLLLTAKGKNKLPIALGFTLVALAVYIPAGYYLELALYRRRQRKRVSEDAERRKQAGR